MKATITTNMNNATNYENLFNVSHAGGIHPLDQLEWEAEGDYTRTDAYVGRMQEIDDLNAQKEWEDQNRLEEWVGSPVSEGGWGMPYSEYDAMWARLLAYADQI